MPPFEPLGHVWRDSLAALVRGAEGELFITAPYISRAGAELVEANAQPRLRTIGRMVLLTDLSPLPICQGANDPVAIHHLSGIVEHSSVFHLPRVHAKVYIADGRRAIVTSGNLTAGGLLGNHEYGLLIDDAATASRIRADLSEYAQLGASIDRGQLEEYCLIAERVRGAYRKQVAEVAESSRREFERSLRDAQDKLVSARLAGGAVHTVFQRTILYLLQHHGPLSTVQLHPLIEAMHPDLCDNSVDRVIDGRSFGKKWKHAARTAQQLLKQKGLIARDGREWRIVSEGSPRHHFPAGGGRISPTTAVVHSPRLFL
jgi:hypothetical protein